MPIWTVFIILGLIVSSQSFQKNVPRLIVPRWMPEISSKPRSRSHKCYLLHAVPTDKESLNILKMKTGIFVVTAFVSLVVVTGTHKLIDPTLPPLELSNKALHIKNVADLSSQLYELKTAIISLDRVMRGLIFRADMVLMTITLWYGIPFIVAGLIYVLDRDKTF